jgi:hypothetical protein
MKLEPSSRVIEIEISPSEYVSLRNVLESWRAGCGGDGFDGDRVEKILERIIEQFYAKSRPGKTA